MSTISLALYTVKVRQSHKTEFLPLNCFDGKADLLVVLEELLTNLKSQLSGDAVNQKALQVKRLERNGRSISGIIFSGEYGVQKDIVNVDTQELVYEQKRNEVDLRPFYFRFHFPLNTDIGIAAFQRFKNYGVRTITAEHLRRGFQEKFSDHLLFIAPLAPREVMDRYLKGDGRITKIRLLKYDLPREITDLYDDPQLLHKDAYAEYTLHFQRASGAPFLAKLKDILDKGQDLTRFIELPEFKHKAIKLELDFNGKKRMLDLSNPQEMRAFYDVTDKVEKDESDYPKFESIDSIASDYIADAFAEHTKSLPEEAKELLS